VWQAICVNSNMALDSRDFLAAIIAFFFSAVRIFNTLRINNSETGFICPTITLSKTDNQNF
jgi:hypothetical protein